MKEEQKQLLLKDLCARLPHGVICKWESDGFSNIGELTDVCHQKSGSGFQYWDGYLNFDGEDIPIEAIKPYLRPMSSMTKEEKNDYINTFTVMWDAVDWLNAHHFDYRGLIPMGLALEAKEGMYKTV